MQHLFAEHSLQINVDDGKLNMKMKDFFRMLVILTLMSGCNYSETSDISDPSEPSLNEIQEKRETKPSNYSDYSFFDYPHKIKPEVDDKVSIIKEFMVFGQLILDSLEAEITVVQNDDAPFDRAEFDDVQDKLNTYRQLIEAKYDELRDKNPLLSKVGLSFFFIGKKGRFHRFGPSPLAKERTKSRDCSFVGDVYSIVWQTDTIAGIEREIKVERDDGECILKNGEKKPAIFYRASGALTKENVQGLNVSLSFDLPKKLRYLDIGVKDERTIQI